MFFSVCILIYISRSLHFVISFMRSVSSVRIIAIPPVPFAFSGSFSCLVFGAGEIYIAYLPIFTSVALVSCVSCMRDMSTFPCSRRSVVSFFFPYS